MEQAIDNFSVENVKTILDQLKAKGVENEEFRHRMEHFLHRKALSFGEPSIPAETVEKFLNFVVNLATEELTAKGLTVLVMQDVFDVSDIKRCEQLFSIIEDNIGIWKQPFFFEACKNTILRMCNDLLKRLSRTVDTNFCGRILILLAKSLPLTEKSGLNLISQFNTANTTTYEEEKKEEKPEEIEEDTDKEDGEIKEAKDKDSSIPVDYTHYVKFWQLQEYLSNPLLCYEKQSSWKKFENNLNEILNIFSTYKLDRQSYKQDRDREKSVLSLMGLTTQNGSIEEEQNLLDSSGKLEKMDWHTSVKEVVEKDDAFFAKYLTNQKLFQLQIADSLFRRYFLVQCLILFQYLTSDVKFRDATYFLTEDQKRFVADATDRCYKLLRETYPHGSHFMESIKKILNREKLWSQWKNEGCPDMLKDVRGKKVSMFKRKPIQHYDPSKIDLGNQELTRLWNVNPDIQAACKDLIRKFVPNVEELLFAALDELDPDQEVEEQYKSVNDESYQWRASRLLMFGTDQYLTTCCYGAPAKGATEPTNTAKFLEDVIKNASTNNGSKELAAKANEVFQRVELKKQQEDERTAEKRRQEEVVQKAAEEAAKASKTKTEEKPVAKEEPKEAGEISPKPVTPVPPSPKKLKQEPIEESSSKPEKVEETRKRRIISTDTKEEPPTKIVEKEKDREVVEKKSTSEKLIEANKKLSSKDRAVKSTVEMLSDEIKKASVKDRASKTYEKLSEASKKLRPESKERIKESSAFTKEPKETSSSSKEPSSKDPQLNEREIETLASVIKDPIKLAKAIHIPLDEDKIPKHRKIDSIVMSILSTWSKRDPSKGTLTKLSMILMASNDFQDKEIADTLKELKSKRERGSEKDRDREKQDKEKHSSSRRHEK